MSVEYDLNSFMQFPDEICCRFIDGYHIVVAPEYPNWLILNENEYKMFLWLQSGLSIRAVLVKYYCKCEQNEEKCLDIMTGLLSQIDDVNFSKDAEIFIEDPIETIKKKVHIGTTNGCNMRCKHCYMAAGTAQLKTIDMNKTIQLVSDLNRVYGLLEVVISGGEPLTYENIEDLLRGLKENYIILFTNGTLISEKNIDLIAECCDEVQISFEGVDKEFYSKIRGEQNYDKVLHAIQLLKERNVKIVLAVTMLPDTISDIRDNLVQFVRNINYSNLEVRLSDEVEMEGNALRMDMSVYNRKESKSVITNLVRQLVKMGCAVQNNDIRNTRFTNCGIGTNVIIHYDGNIYPCHKISNYYVEHGTAVHEIINKFNRLNRETSNVHIDKCQECELRYICAGGCRIDNYMKTGNMNTVICNEEFKEEQYRRLLENDRMYRA